MHCRANLNLISLPHSLLVKGAGAHVINHDSKPGLAQAHACVHALVGACTFWQFIKKEKTKTEFLVLGSQVRYEMLCPLVFSSRSADSMYHSVTVRGDLG